MNPERKPRPIIALEPIGNGRALAHVLARVLVRRELILADALPEATHCTDRRITG